MRRSSAEPPRNTLSPCRLRYHLSYYQLQVVGANSTSSILVYVIAFTAGASHLLLLTVLFDPRKR
jgi:hypothetical protein